MVHGDDYAAAGPRNQLIWMSKELEGLSDEAESIVLSHFAGMETAGLTTHVRGEVMKLHEALLGATSQFP